MKLQLEKMVMDFWDIYYNYHDRLRKFIFALFKDEWIADDLIQETFIRVQNNLNQLREESKLKPWMFRIAYNLCQDHFRKMNKLSQCEHARIKKKEILT